MPADARPVLLTGATGFVGGHVLRELLCRGYAVRALVRRSGALGLGDFRLTEVVGDILDPVSVVAGAAGCQAVVHLVGIIKEGEGAGFWDVHVVGTGNVVWAAGEAGVGRFVHMSALGTRPEAVSAYHQSKWAGEELVRRGGMAYTIFRPSLIHGADGEFTGMLRAWARGAAAPYWFMPYFGRGFLGQANGARVAPVYVGDVARVFVQALSDPRAANRTYDVVGPEAYTWPEFLTLAARVLTGKPKAAVGVPAWLARLLVALRIPVPFNGDQVIMSLEDNTASPPSAPACTFPPDFLGPTPLRSFAQALGEYRTQMG